MRSTAYKLPVDAKQKIPGALVLSDNASGLISSLTLAMVNGLDVDTLYRHSILLPYLSSASGRGQRHKPLLTEAEKR